MSAPTMPILRRAVVAAAILAIAGLAQAQQANASAAAFGLAGNYIARAHGYQALAWNPAMLGMPGNPGFSFGTLAVSGNSGLDPVDLNAFAPYSGKDIPVQTRQTWLSQVQAKNGETGTADGGASLLGLSAGPFALQVSSSGYATAKLSPDAFEVVMFGNAGNTGSAHNLSFQGSSLTSGAFTTAAIGYGHALAVPLFSGLSSLSVGVTGKYIIGNAVAMAEDAGSALDTNNVNVNFPMVYSDPGSHSVVGSGYGMDLGVAWTGDGITGGASIQNVFNTFAWDQSKMKSQVATASFDGTTTAVQTTDQPYSAAPQTLRDKIANDKFTPVLGAGIAYQLASKVVISGDAHQQVGDGISIGPKTSIGTGLEYRGIPFIPLRAGGSYVTDGWVVGGGLGVAIGPYELGVSGRLGQRNGARDGGVMLNLISIH